MMSYVTKRRVSRRSSDTNWHGRDSGWCVRNTDWCSRDNTPRPTHSGHPIDIISHIPDPIIHRPIPSGLVLLILIVLVFRFHFC
ncbi:hypothetical protein Dimus_038008 [Dionaea muscipula]